MAKPKKNPGIPLLDTTPETKKQVVITNDSDKQNPEPNTLKEVVNDTTPKLNNEVINEEGKFNEQLSKEELELLDNINHYNQIIEKGSIEENNKSEVTGSEEQAKIFHESHTRHDGGIHF